MGKNIKIFHEAPKSIFHRVQEITGGDYFLVHLFETDPEYLALAKEAVAKGREVILDNSIFELGKAFNMDRFAYWINELKPTYYIVPDVLEDSKGTIQNMKNWIENYKDKVTGKVIGVVQGKTYDDIVECYKYMDTVANVDRIAISFDYSEYERLYPHENRLMSWVLGRVLVLNLLETGGIINKSKEHHLLGCGLPCEGMFYFNKPWIVSVDTSNPVTCGYEHKTYSLPFGQTTKSPIKLYKIMGEVLDQDQEDKIQYNIGEFRKFWDGTYVMS